MTEPFSGEPFRSSLLLVLCNRLLTAAVSFSILVVCGTAYHGPFLALRSKRMPQEAQKTMSALRVMHPCPAIAGVGLDCGSKWLSRPNQQATRSKRLTCGQDPKSSSAATLCPGL